MDAGIIKEVLKKWDLDYIRSYPQIKVCGSPERCCSRIVVDSGDLFVLEELYEKTVERKAAIASCLDQLKHKKMPSIHPYLSPHIIEYKARSYQIMPYIKGVSLPRPDYIHDKWRGEKLAEFLIQLNKKSANLSNDPFSLPKYVDNIMDTIRKHEPKLSDLLLPITQHLKGFLRRYDDLPTGFCHGDYHTINVIWGENEIRSVIDWEFCGLKPELYDAATLIGCVGIENPDILTKGLCAQFITTLKKVKFDDMSWQTLPELTLAIRFAWMSEWLRKRDSEMINLELAYMRELIKRRKNLIFS